MKNIIEECYNFMKADNKEIAVFADYKLGNKTLNYEEVKKYISALNNIIGTNNYTKRIGVLIENKLEFVEAFFSILYNGYTVVGIDPKITEEGLEKIIDENELKYIITNSTNIQKLLKYKDKIIINIEEVDISNIKEEKITIPNSKLEDINSIITDKQVIVNKNNDSLEVELVYEVIENIGIEEKLNIEELESEIENKSM